MEIDFPHNFSVDDLVGRSLWRYLDLYKLLDLLNSNQLYFSRFDKFEDGLEGITGKGTSLKAFTQSAPLTEENINPRIQPEMRKNLIRNDQERREEYLETITGSQQAQYASCWFFGEKESLAMWKLYSKQNGVALRFNAKELADSIILSAQNVTNTDFHILYMGPVDYKNIWPFDPHEKFDGKFNGLNKDNSYKHESEFRFVAVVPMNKKGVHEFFRLPIGELKSYEVEIIANPFIEPWQFENLKQLLSKFYLDTRLSLSKMEIRK